MIEIKDFINIFKADMLSRTLKNNLIKRIQYFSRTKKPLSDKEALSQMIQEQVGNFLN